MNKKGLDYAALLTVIVLISLVTLFANLQGKLYKTGRFLGDAQSPMLSINTEAQFYQAYVKEAAKLAIEQTVNDVAQNPQYQGLSPSDCVQLNTLNLPKQLAYTNLHDGINTAFNKNMNKYMTEYAQKTKYTIPLDNFKATAFKGELTGVSVKPTTIPIKDYAGKVFGNASFRPSIKIQYNHGFETYPEIFRTLTAIVGQCSYATDTAACTIKILPANWKIEQKGDIFQFRIPRGTTETCYALIIPPKTTTPTI
ncbi:Uncharacterised protein [uncultured archaeon]|nr:Uncharacterised protein [uncultured archaeon]